MRRFPPRPRSTSTTRLAWALAFIVLGMRLAVFEFAGSPLPYFDQWMAEYNNIFLLAMNGGSLGKILFTHHNEHILLTTKLLSLAGFALNGYWDVKFLVCLAALVRAGEAAWAFRLLSAGGRPAVRLIVWVGCALVFALPLSGYNLLCGMQVSFFLADLAMLWSIRTVLHWRKPGSSGGQLCCSMVFGLLSLGSAIAIPAVTLAVHLAQRRPRAGFWVAWAISVMLAGLYVLQSSALASGGSSLPGWPQLIFFFQLLSWPVMHAGLGLLVVLFAGTGLWQALRTGAGLKSGAAAGTGLAVFAVANAALLALSRLRSDFHMRHWDTVSLIVLSVIVLGAFGADAAGRLRRPALFGLSGLIALAAAFFCLRMNEQSLPYLRSGHADRETNVQRYRANFLSGGLQQDFDRINAMLRVRDYSFYDDPVYRFVPHPVVSANIMRRPLPMLALLSPEIMPTRELSPLSVVVQLIIRHGWIFLLPGVGLALAGIAGLRHDEPPAGEPA
jgi:hypothetical protein